MYIPYADTLFTSGVKIITRSYLEMIQREKYTFCYQSMTAKGCYLVNERKEKQ